MKTPAKRGRSSTRSRRSIRTPTPSCTTATPFELLVATILSAQSTDQRVNLVTPALFKRYPDARALAQATPDGARAADSLDRVLPREVEGARRHGAGARRASTAARCRPTWRRSSTLPGVGRKTANVVLGHALGVPGLPVDRHVLRVANRIGIAESDDPEVVEQQLVRRAAARALDAHLRHADPARPPHLQAQAALRSVRRCGTTATTSARVVARARAGERRRRPGRSRAEDRGAMTRAEFERLVADALASIPRRFREGDAEHRHRRRGRAVGRPARRDGDRAARHAVRPLSGHAAHRARAGATATRCPTASCSFRVRTSARPRTRTTSIVVDRRDADPRDRPLLRHERGRDRGDRGEVLARRRRQTIRR